MGEEKVSVLTLWQPWATLMALGLKDWETRSWHTEYRGILAIQAAAKKDRQIREAFDHYSHLLTGYGFETYEDLPYGAIVCVGSLSRIVPAHVARDRLPDQEVSLGDYSDGRYAWRVGICRPVVPPIPVKGQQGIWHLKDPQARSRVLEAFGA